MGTIKIKGRRPVHGAMPGNEESASAKERRNGVGKKGEVKEGSPTKKRKKGGVPQGRTERMTRRPGG